jgi:cytochrome c553
MAPRTLRTKVSRGIGAAILGCLLAAGAIASGTSAQREVDGILRLKPNPARGAEIFTHCAACHEDNVQGLPAGWVPVIAGQQPRYLVKQLLDYRHSVRRDPHMEPVAQGHVLRGPQDIADVVAFVAATDLQGHDTAAMPSAVVTDAQHLYRLDCSHCHGRSGEGNDRRGIPRLAGQDFAYLLRQMHDVVDGPRANMRATHYRALCDLDVQALMRLASYLSHLSGAGADAAASDLSAALGADPRWRPREGQMGGID